MDTVVVTASRYAVPLRATGRRVEVWSAADIAELPVSSVDELLRTAAGVEMQSRGGFGVQSDFTIRGSSFKGVLVLVDGARLNDPQTAHYQSDLPVPLASIARVEVLRGPAAALYGPDAIGGVVHIVTRTGLRTQGDSERGPGGSLTLRGGAHALYDVETNGRYAGPQTTVSAAGTWQASDGERVTSGGEVVRYDDAAGTPVRTDFARQAYTAALARRLGPAMLYARFGYDHRDFGAYQFYTPFPSDRARNDKTTAWGQLRLDGRLGPATTWEAQLAAKQHTSRYVYNEARFGAGPPDTSRLGTVQLHLRHRLSPGLTVAGGLSGQRRGIRSLSSMGHHDDGAAGAFVSGRWQVVDALTAQASGRLDYDDAFGLQATPQLSLAYQWRSATLRAAAGRAVRAPTYTERYYDTVADVAEGNLGNPNLRAEHSWSYEAGADLYPANGLTLHATAFYRSTRDFIDYATEPPNDTLFLARNVRSVTTRGLELEVNRRQPLPVGRLTLRAAYTRLGADLGPTDAGVQTKYALTSARQLGQATATWTAGGWMVTGRGLWKDRRARDGYAVVDARLARRWALGRQHLTLSAEVRNVLDAAYSDVFGAPMPGRWWLLGLRVTR